MQKKDLSFVRTLRISEAVRGVSVDLCKRLTSCFYASQWLKGFCAVVRMILSHSHGDLGLHFCRGKAQACRGWIFLMKELPYGCIFTLQDVTTMQLSTDIDKVSLGGFIHENWLWFKQSQLLFKDSVLGKRECT